MTLVLFGLVVLVLAREYFYQRERAAIARERQLLLQRIQAPSMAVTSFATEEAAEPISGLPLIEDADYEALMHG